MQNLSNSFRIRSFVGRNSRETSAQKIAQQSILPLFGLSKEKIMDKNLVFKNQAETFLEIGFGTGQSLLALAKNHPDKNFIGIETHKPGIGALCIGIKTHELTNLRIYHTDAVLVLEHSIPDHSLDGVQIFFPDPWPKRRHHARRLIQPEFVALISKKLKLNGSFHLATDWEDYAHHMMRVLSLEKTLVNEAGEYHFSTRSAFRPILTKFEKRALREGRLCFELQFKKSNILA